MKIIKKNTLTIVSQVGGKHVYPLGTYVSV